MAVNVDELLNKVEKRLYIDGQWVEGSAGGTFHVENPATGEVIATLASASSADALAALDAADRVQRDWGRTAPRERAEILRRGFELVGERAEEFATLMTLEMGKPIAEARSEVRYANEFLRWFSEETVRHYGRYNQVPEGTLRMITTHKPVGPSLLITPWNFPLAMATRKIGPAIAAGCTMIVKPAQLTPLTMHYFVQTMIEAGVPGGVLNLVTSKSASGISTPLLADQRLRKLSFTGSTPVGRQLLKASADNVLRTSMELGGNAPFIVFADADLEAAVEGAVDAKMRNVGEACTAANRILVQESVAGEFGRKLADRLGEMQVGNGLDEGVQVGPLIEAEAVDSVAELVDAAVTDGATVLTGGVRGEGEGHFYAPTVLVDVARTSRVVNEEIFGPVAPVVAFSDEEDAWKLANDTEYGLAAYVYSSDVSRMFRASDHLEFGLLGVNSGVISNAGAPFGGVKHSGLGREGGAEGIAEYTSVQYIGIADPYAK